VWWVCAVNNRNSDIATSSQGTSPVHSAMSGGGSKHNHHVE
jgi:hypothetical protein